MENTQDKIDELNNAPDKLFVEGANNVKETPKNWWEEPLPVGEIEKEIHQAEPYNPSESDDEQMTGLKKFMNLSTVPHANVAQEIKTLIINGHIDPIQMYVALKRVDKIQKLCLDSQEGDKELREVILNKVRTSLDGGKSIDMYGANLRIQATGTNYDFSECGDTTLNEMYKIQAELKARIKQREDYIKVVLPPDTNKLGIQSTKIIVQGIPSLVWSDDEFEETIFPAIKRAGESVICTFKKEK